MRSLPAFIFIASVLPAQADGPAPSARDGETARAYLLSHRTIEAGSPEPPGRFTIASTRDFERQYSVGASGRCDGHFGRIGGPGPDLFLLDCRLPGGTERRIRLVLSESDRDTLLLEAVHVDGTELDEHRLAEFARNFPR